MKHRSSEAVSSSSSSSTPAIPEPSPAVTSSSSSDKPIPSVSAAADLVLGPRDGSGGGAGQETVTIDRRGDYSAVCRWRVENFPRVRAKQLWSKYFEVGGYDCRLLVYPKGDSQALRGYISLYLQIMDPRGTSSSKWDCFSSYRLSIVNLVDDSMTHSRDSWHRFSSKKKSHGWCDFTHSDSILDPKLNYLSNNDSVLITADILILKESVNFSRDNNEGQSSSSVISPSVVAGSMPDVLNGKFTWKVHNFSLFREMIKSQKIMSPVFRAGECNLRISVYQSSVNGEEYMSMCLESKDTEKSTVSDRSCWCLFRMSVLNQTPGNNHMHRDSHGRFAADNKTGDNTSLGWNDYMRLSDFISPDAGFLVDDTAVFTTSFHVIKEFSSFSKNGGLIGGKNAVVAKKFDGHMGKFTWRIENFTRLKDLLKKRKITGLCIKSRRFQIGNRDCRLIVYPRGQSQPPCHLSVFLEVTDSHNNSSDWSCFVSHRLSVLNQRAEDKSVTKESQNRYSKAAKDWGWREFVTLTSLFDQDSGFLVQDTVIFCAEVLILKETSIMQDFTDEEVELPTSGSQIDNSGKRSSFTWKVENFLAFKDIMETRKIFSKFFQAGGCELRIGVYESFDTICIYLESDQSVANDPDKNFWVKYRMGIVNQKNPAKTVWKESSICTKTWNNSVLQFVKVSDMLEANAGFLVRDTVVFVCEILDCCPWFEFSDLEVLASDDDQDALTTDPDELVDSEDSEGISGDEEDIFQSLLSRAGFHLSYGDNPSQPQVTLREKLLMDAGAIAGFLTGLRVYLDDPAKVKRLLLPTKLSNNDGRKMSKDNVSSPSLMNMLMGVKVLQQAIIDLLLDIMVECCQPSEGVSPGEPSDINSVASPVRKGATSPSESNRENEAMTSTQGQVFERLDSGVDGANLSAVGSSDMNGIDGDVFHGMPTPPTETSSSDASSESVLLRSKTKWPEQSEELLGLIINSLRALDGAVPRGCPEPRRRPQSAQKIALVMDKAPKHLQSDLVSLVPRLVESSEHPLAANDLLERLQEPDTEPALRIPVFGALSQLECGSETWNRILFQSFELLRDSNGEPLVATMDFMFKAALQCQHIPEAVRAVRVRLKNLGLAVSPCVLDFLCKTVNCWGDIAETILKDIDCDDKFGADSSTVPQGISMFGGNGHAAERFHASVDHDFGTLCHFSDVYILIEMLSIPRFAVQASKIFERAVGEGAIVAPFVAMILNRRLSQHLNSNSSFTDERSQQSNNVIKADASEQPGAQMDDLSTLLGLAEALSRSRERRVRDFVKMLYVLLFKRHADESCRGRMLKILVERATSCTDGTCEFDLELETLVILICEEQEVVRPVLTLMREVALLANVDRATLWHQLCATEDEIVRMREEKKTEISNMAKDTAALSQKLCESEAASTRLKSELKAEIDRFAREKKELSEHVQEVESQLEWVRLERNDEITKLSADKKTLQDRLHDAETQVAQLKSRKLDELKRVVKEKNALAERLKSAEASRKRFDEELKRVATENVTREEIRQSLEDEIRRLTQTVGQTEGEKRDKEEQVARCEAYIDGMESKLQACQQYIHTLEGSLQEEMSRHAPLYGAGLEALSMKELETLARIHEDGIRQIHTLQQQRNVNPVGSPLVTLHGLPSLLNHVLYPPGPPQPMAVGFPPSLVPNGVDIHSNGHISGGPVGPWFNHHS